MVSSAAYPMTEVEVSDVERIREAALNTQGGRMARDEQRGSRSFDVPEVQSIALAAVYVGDQVGRLADAVERLAMTGRLPVDATLRVAPGDVQVQPGYHGAEPLPDDPA